MQLFFNGSSPLAWGTLVNYHEYSLELRFIPTGVGNTSLVPGYVPIKAVHPHWRGEHQKRVTGAIE